MVVCVFLVELSAGIVAFAYRGQVCSVIKYVAIYGTFSTKKLGLKSCVSIIFLKSFIYLYGTMSPPTCANRLCEWLIKTMRAGKLL